MKKVFQKRAALSIALQDFTTLALQIAAVGLAPAFRFAQVSTSQTRRMVRMVVKNGS
jgi:hypothetical protein